ncbi:hypothetical protein NESM_000155200 [Novymonas esmeraldas]|uniref:Uncharacterized protein n=1 Tax=Novymonas esmeraldas TaxID=1808958 RepID=A0AAW0F5M4_9TRYP
MFFAGGTFGHESEARDANRRPTGRRHQARDMAEVQATVDAARGAPATSVAEEARHTTAQRQMATGPSFLDRMYDHNSTIVESAQPTRRRGSAPPDHLNIFSWQEVSPTAAASGVRQPAAGTGAPRAARPVNPTTVAATAEDRRAQESKKFEAHQESAFLRFSDAPKATPAGGAAGQRGARYGAAPPPPPPPPPSHTEGGMMGNLMRDQPEKARGRRGQAPVVAPGKRRSGAEAEMGVAGFPGMGQRSAPRGVPHLTRKPVQSNVFPPTTSEWAERAELTAGDAAHPTPASAGGPPPPPPQRAPPSYHIDEDDYDDHHPQQPYTHEIEIDDDDDDEGHEAPHRTPGGGRNPEWLHDSADDAHNGGRPAESPSTQQRRYNFDAEGQRFYEAPAASHGSSQQRY